MTTSPSDKPEGRGDSYHIYNAKDSAIGPNAFAVNISGGNAEQAAQAIARLLAEQRQRLPPEQAAGLEAQLRQLQAQVGQGFADVRAGQGALSAQMESAVGNLQATLLARLDAQESALTGEILAVLESGGVAADELDRHLAAIEGLIGQARAADPPVQAALAQAQAVLAAPGLDVRSKLKVTVPLIPFLLDYEGELELGQQMNVEAALAALWQALVGWVRG